MKKLIGLRKPLTELDGTPIKEMIGQNGNGPIVRDVLLGQAVANLIYKADAQADAMLIAKLAHKLYDAGDSLQVEDAEHAIIRGIVEKDQGLRVFARAAMLELLDGAGEVKSK